MIYRKIALLAIIALLPTTSVKAQLAMGGLTRDNNGKTTNTVANQAWSFESTTEYFQGNRTYDVVHLIYTAKGARQESWQNSAVRLDAIDTKQAPREIILYDRQNPELLFQGTVTNSGLLLRPSRTSCLTILMKEVQKEGEQKIRQKFDIPSQLDLQDPWSILGDKNSKSFRRAFAVNDLPSGFGWPLFMFRLSVFTPDTIKAGKAALHQIGTEKVAGLPCVRYTFGNSTLWVEPKTKIVLRQETVIMQPGSRQPPIKVGYVTSAFRFLTAVKPSTFSLPAGATIELPELLADISLPPNVRRKPIEGEEAKVGFALQTYLTTSTGVLQQ